MPTSFSATLWDRPSVFISYRWGEDDDWVDKFASDVRRNGVEVIYDKWASHDWDYDDTEDLLDKLFIAMGLCHAFIPIFTDGYLRRAGFKDGVVTTSTNTDDGIVFDEFQRSIVLSQHEQIETVAVLLRGSESILPPPFNVDNILDMRDASAYDAQMQRLAQYLQVGRAIPNKGDPFERKGIIEEHGIRFYED